MADLKDIWKRGDDFVLSRLDWLAKNVNRSQGALLSSMVSEYFGKFALDDSGKIKPTVVNMRLVLTIDKLFDALDSKTLRAINTRYGEDMLKLTDIRGRYYSAMGSPADVVKSVAEKVGFIEQAIGIKYIEIEGKQVAELIKGGYLDTITRMPEVRQQIKDYVVTSVANKKGFDEYLRGMKEIVVGTNTRDGALERYYKQFAYDTFNDTDAAINKHYADSLDLTWFVYTGSLIDTSREFCRKRAGKTFSVEETEDWKCDPTLIGKPKGVKCDQKYNPLIERGRYNCRHTIRYISDELACENGRKEACQE